MARVAASFFPDCVLIGILIASGGLLSGCVRSEGQHCKLAIQTSILADDDGPPQYHGRNLFAMQLTEDVFALQFRNPLGIYRIYGGNKTEKISKIDFGAVLGITSDEKIVVYEPDSGTWSAFLHIFGLEEKYNPALLKTYYGEDIYDMLVPSCVFESNLLFCNGDTRTWLTDLSQPLSAQAYPGPEPRIVNDRDMVMYHGKYAYQSGEYEGMYVVDAFDLRETTSIKGPYSTDIELSYEGHFFRSIEISGDYLLVPVYIGNESGVGESGVNIYALSDPLSPRLVGTYRIDTDESQCGISALEAVGIPNMPAFFLYTVRGEGPGCDRLMVAVELVSMADPSNPERVALFEIGSEFSDTPINTMKVIGTRLFLGDTDYVSKETRIYIFEPLSDQCEESLQ